MYIGWGSIYRLSQSDNLLLINGKISNMVTLVSLFSNNVKVYSMEQKKVPSVALEFFKIGERLLFCKFW